MSVTIFPNGPVANVLSTMPEMQGHLPNLYRNGTCKEMIQTSLSGPDRYWHLTGNGFVNAVHTAYSNHHHLEIRPDDVWFAILTQLNYYINEHAEEMRGMFVTFEGRKELEIEVAAPSRYTVDHGQLANDMSQLMQENIVDPDLRKWIQPSFSTTTRKDTIIASIIMMATLQEYFDYVFKMVCGLPSVTLLGAQVDWEDILQRIEKLPSFGAEPKQFYRLLKPVLKRFVMSFDNPESPEVISFWQRPLRRMSLGSGGGVYTGWMTAFSFWNARGKSLYPEYLYSDTDADTSNVDDETSDFLKLDDVVYHHVDEEDLPPGWVEAPVTIKDNGVTINSTIAAGSMGIEWFRRGGSVDPTDVKLDSLRPVTEWWIYEKGTEWKKQADRNDFFGRHDEL